MKKGFAVLLSVFFAVFMGITAVAASNNFVVSPSGNKNPELVDWEPTDDECNAQIIVTPFADRADLDDESRAQLEEARDIIVDTSDLAELNDDLKSKVDSLGVDSKYIEISDLFDVDYGNCDIHDEHGEYKLWLKSDSLDKFVGLLHFDGEDWTMIDATIDEDGNLVYSTDKTGAFAIVLNTYEEESSSGGPQTGDEFHWWIYVAIMAVSAAALIVIALKLKKTEDK